VPSDRARPARHSAGQCWIPLQSIVRALPRQCRAEPYRRDGWRYGRSGADVPRATRHPDLGHHRWRARAQSAFPAARRLRPPPEAALEADYRRILGEQYGVVFNSLFTLANMPIQRFGAILISQGQFDEYLALLRRSHLDTNLDGVMCRNLISVDYRGYVYDC